MKGISLKNMRQLDKSKMLELLLDFPAQCKIALELAKEAKILFTQRDFKKVVFAGLGGSAIGADLVRSYLYFESKIPITVCREYDLPAYVDSQTLVFISSYSGNTEETLSAYAQAQEKKATIIAISSGGALKEKTQKEQVSFIQIPAGLPPRCALGYLSIVPLFLLFRLGLVSQMGPEIFEMIKTLEELKKNQLSPRIAISDNPAKSVAMKLANKFVIIYSAAVHFDVCAIRLRGQLNENSKTLASSHLFPEMNHNEIVGWENPRKLFKNFMVVLLRDKKEHPQVAKRIQITKEIIAQEGVNIIEIWSRGEGLLSRIFSLIYTADFISYYLAIRYGIDPTPVERVTYLKNELSKSK